VGASTPPRESRMATSAEQKLLDAYERIAARIRSGKSTAGEEREYGKAYQELVKAGLAQPIKRKYSKK